MKTVALFVYDVTQTGGAEHVALNLAEEFSKNYRVHLISLFASGNEMPAELPYTVHVLHKEVQSIPLHLAAYSRLLKRCLKDNHIEDMLIITAGIVSVAVLAARGTKTRTIYCEHSNLENKTYGKKHELRQYIGARYSDVVVTLTERDRRNFIKAYQLPENRVLTIPNWIPFEHTSCVPYALSSKRIVTVGRLETVKGHDMLLQAAELVQKKHPDWHWDIFGDGSLRQSLQEQINATGLQDFVTLKGNVNDIQKRYPDYALFVLTSRYEGLPLVLLEAQNAGLPIVSFDCPTGPAEIIDDKINGYIVPAYDVSALAEAVNTLIEDDTLRGQFAEKAPLHIHRFSKKTVSDRWYALLDDSDHR